MLYTFLFFHFFIFFRPGEGGALFSKEAFPSDIESSAMGWVASGESPYVTSFLAAPSIRHLSKAQPHQRGHAEGCANLACFCE